METASSFQGDVCCPFWSFFMHVSLFIAECMNCTHNYCALCCAAMMSRCFPSASTPDVRNTGCSYRTIWELIYYLQPTAGSLTFPAFWSDSTPHWALTCYFHQQSRYSCSQLDYFTQQRQVLSLSVAAFGSAVKCWKDKLNIIVYWISGSINWAVLREKPENMFQPLDRDRWLSSACPVSWGHTTRGQAPVEV